MSILSTVLFLLRTRKHKCPLGQKLCVLKDKKSEMSFRTRKDKGPSGQEKINVLEDKKRA